jgi:transposase
LYGVSVRGLTGWLQTSFSRGLAAPTLSFANSSSILISCRGLQPHEFVPMLGVHKAEKSIEVACAETLWGCPQCSHRMHRHDTQRRRWRRLDSCQFKTIIVADVPRVECAQHGTQMVPAPGAEPRSRFTAWFERLAIDRLGECSTSAACEQLRIRWDEADGIKQRAIDRGLRRRQVKPLRRLCADEKAVGWGHPYVTIVSVARTERKRVSWRSKTTVRSEA